MDKIKKIIETAFTQIKVLTKSYPITTILIMFVTLLVSILVDQNFSDKIVKVIEKMYAFCVIWGFGTYFTENYFFAKIKKISSYLITAVISVLFTKLIFLNLDNYASTIGRFLSCYLIVLISISLYKVVKNKNLTFSKYLMNLFKDLVSYTIIYFILSIGIGILLLIFIELILDGNYEGSVLLRTEILLYGWYYVLSMLYAISNMNEKKENSFVKGLVLYVLLPLVVMAMFIIYIYIAKIIIFRKIPKNIIFRILAGIFVIGFPIWNMASCYNEEKKWIKKITLILPYLYIPFFFLEIYSIGIRIYNFGITPARYFSCAFIIFQIFAIFFNIYKKKKMDLLFIILAIFGIILLITPINYENISNLSQKSIIEKYLKENNNFDDLDEDAKNKIKGAYEYLSNKNRDKYLPDYLTKETIKKIKQYKTTINLEMEEFNYFYDIEELDLKIDQYVQIIKVSGNFNGEKKIKLDKIDKTIDLSELIKNIIKEDKINEKRSEKYFEDNNLIYVDELYDLYIENINFDYSDNENIKYLFVDGYLLLRNVEK